MKKVEFKKGDFISDGRRTGVVDEENYKDQEKVLCLFHNGMKIKTYYVDSAKLIKVSKENFLRYIGKSGNTSFRAYVK